MTGPRSPHRAAKTRRSVRIADRSAGLVIRLAGLGTIGAVSLVCLFLVWVALPLFRSQSIEAVPPVPADALAVEPLQLGVDEYESLAWAALPDGRVQVLSLHDGSTVAVHDPFDGRRPSASTIDPIAGRAAFGFADGTVQLGQLRFRSRLSSNEEAAASLPVGAWRVEDGGVTERISKSRLRHVSLAFEVEKPFAIAGEDPDPTLASPVVLLDQSMAPSGPTLAALTEDCTLWLRRVRQRTNLMTGDVTIALTGGSTGIDECRRRGRPDFLGLTGTGDGVFLVWRGGMLQRISARDVNRPQLAEQIEVGYGGDAEITAVGFLIGKKTLVVGDSNGDVHTWFRTKPQGAPTVDGVLLADAAHFEGRGSAVAALAPSHRSRALAIAYADGSVRVVHVTSGRIVGEARADEAGGSAHPPTAVAFTPREDSVYSLGAGAFSRWRISAPHPEVSLTTLFRPVWYEGYEAPALVWQSSSGTDDFEPKLGLVPLVFGTIKATFYSMLFGAPLALLAAIYTSEFLDPRVRSRIKPGIELMASLPSVVLGFLAAIVFAPLVENIVPETLTAVFAVPVCLLLAAHVARLQPPRVSAAIRRQRLLAAGVCLPIGVLLAFAVGPSVERALFAGDFKLWLTGNVGDGTGGWMLLLLPLSAIAVTLTGARVTLKLAERLPGNTSLSAEAIGLVRFVAGTIAMVALAWGVSSALTAAGLDPRGSFLGTYVQRNAMIVGFVMGFAIVPIIYTIAEDALSSVPAHLRAGSLALGATPWQTASRIVVPTAMSGLFSAIMIGLGRAVGETMIVLMAAGNTPVLDWNLFNGFRTLSANIAVELPEAVRNSTHYRTLFLAALLLFAMTFTINTAAEIIRLRFRKRAYQL